MWELITEAARAPTWLGVTLLGGGLAAAGWLVRSR